MNTNAKKRAYISGVQLRIYMNKTESGYRATAAKRSIKIFGPYI